MDDFVARLRTVTQLVGSPHRLAKLTGLSYTGIRKYLDGADPSRCNLISIARAGNVDLKWLALGEGTMRPDGMTANQVSAPTAALQGDQPALDLNLLEKILHSIESVACKGKRTCPNANAKAHLVTTLYDLYRTLPANSAIRKTTVERLMEMVGKGQIPDQAAIQG